MPLINIQTDFKNLSFGSDRPGQESSSEPYVVAPIPQGEIPPNSPDFILRNASSNILQFGFNIKKDDNDSTPVKPDSILGDLKRITKFFFKKGIIPTTKGLLFTIKQNLLEFQSPSIPENSDLFLGEDNLLKNIYLPSSTIAQVAVNAFGGHLNKTGLNPFSLSYYQGGDKTRYYGFISNKENNTSVKNRLSLLRFFKLYNAAPPEFADPPEGSSQLSTKTNAVILNILPSINLLKGNGNNAKDTILQYLGGPGDFLLFTRIRRWDYTNIYDLKKYASGQAQNGAAVNFNADNRVLTFDQDTLLNLGENNNDYFNSNNKPNIAGQTKSSNFVDFRKILVGDNGVKQLFIPYTNYETFNRPSTYKISSTNYRNQNFITDPNKSVSSDYINKQDVNVTGTAENGNDLIDFKFEILNNDNQGQGNSNFTLQFRSYIKSLSDTFKPDWQSYKYVGRAENFYKYGGFARDINLAFDIYAHSRDEMAPLYQKLNCLVGTTAPSYSGIGLMRGIIVKLTVGDYIRDVPGIITNLGLKPSFEAGWDLNRNEAGILFTDKKATQYVGQLPRLIDVDMSFTPIHSFAPEFQKQFIGTMYSTFYK